MNLITTLIVNVPPVFQIPVRVGLEIVKASIKFVKPRFDSPVEKSIIITL